MVKTKIICCNCCCSEFTNCYKKSSKLIFCLHCSTICHPSVP